MRDFSGTVASCRFDRLFVDDPLSWNSRLDSVAAIPERISNNISQSATGKLSPRGTAQPPPFNLSWTHYVFLLGIKDPDERSFYEIESTQQNWTVRELKREFNSGLYERLALSRDKAAIRRLAKEGQLVSQPHDLLKEPLVLEFLALVEITLSKDANIHTREYQLYLPGKDELKRKLVEWTGEHEPGNR
jgi:hypothetical protein